MKSVKTRDSATSILRKLGINSRDYNLFIDKYEGGFHVRISDAKKHVASGMLTDLIANKDVVVKPAATPEGELAKELAGNKQLPPVDKEKVAKLVSKVKRQTISSLTEELIIAGKQNHEVWSAIKERFKLGDDKKHYPSWFRSRLRRQGKLPKKEKKS